ncbi:acyl-CoA thioesterase [Halorarum salinum]|uniref:Acyl-CoA thioesterase n=1 Tax=Halorarum salinum TaxID=2743089 RepID=A0A7D5QI45_9EURY|nr:thioesterase family protein [Halobaculum salinum]QLG60365.1 acyl-CoA thioesterase [Halobaculum salinum]
MSDIDPGGNATPDFTADFTTEMQVRFRDIDAMNHVNNAVYATYLEQARAEYYQRIVGEDLSAVDTVLVSLELDYRRPIELGDSVTVGLEIGELGRSSVPMDYEIYAGDRLAAVGHTVQVFVDNETGNSKPIPAELRTTMTE